MNIAELAEKLGLTEEEYLELVQLLVETGKEDLTHAEAAIERKDAQEARHRLHSLKGAAGNLGLMDLYDQAKEGEQMARDGMLDHIPDITQRLRSGLDSIAALVRMGEETQSRNTGSTTAGPPTPSLRGG